MMPTLRRYLPIRSPSLRAFTVAAALSCTAFASLAQPYGVGVYTSPVKSFSTASYWLVGQGGLVMLDTQFLPKEGLEALQKAQTATGKKASHALVLHPNPDKFNGTAAYQALGVQVLTAEQVAREIPAVHVIRLGWFADDFKPDYPLWAHDC